MSDLLRRGEQGEMGNERKEGGEERSNVKQERKDGREKGEKEIFLLVYLRCHNRLKGVSPLPQPPFSPPPSTNA